MTDLLILGATGKVGRLLKARWSASLDTLWQTRGAPLGPDWVQAALQAPLPQAKVLFVLSGVTSGDEAALSQNSAIAEATCQAALAMGARHVLFASTMAVYGPNPWAAEGDAPRSPNAYGASKLAAEAVAERVLGGTKVGLTALRLGNVVGADLLGVMRARGGRLKLDRFLDGQGPYRSYLGPSLLARVVEGLTLQVLAGKPLPRVLNIAAQAPLGMADLLQAAQIGFDWAEAMPTALQRVAMDCSALAALIPPHPALETAEALAKDWLEITP